MEFSRVIYVIDRGLYYARSRSARGNDSSIYATPIGAPQKTLNQFRAHQYQYLCLITMPVVDNSDQKVYLSYLLGRINALQITHTSKVNFDLVADDIRLVIQVNIEPDALRSIYSIFLELKKYQCLPTVAESQMKFYGIPKPSIQGGNINLPRANKVSAKYVAAGVSIAIVISFIIYLIFNFAL